MPFQEHSIRILKADKRLRIFFVCFSCTWRHPKCPATWSIGSSTERGRLPSGSWSRRKSSFTLLLQKSVTQESNPHPMTNPLSTYAIDATEFLLLFNATAFYCFHNVATLFGFDSENGRRSRAKLTTNVILYFSSISILYCPCWFFVGGLIVLLGGITFKKEQAVDKKGWGGVWVFTTNS